MCGRFAITLPADAMSQLFSAASANDLPGVSNFNVCPTQAVHVVRQGVLGRQLVAMRWGFLPSWYQSPEAGPLLINARAETLAEKPAFRAAAVSRRCIIPASGFYEWTRTQDGGRLPWYISRRDRTPVAFAGLWQDWGEDSLSSCAIVTTEANTSLSEIHHRMPLILEPEAWPLWLGEEGRGASRLMQPGAEGQLVWHRVSTAVNSNRAQGSGLIEPWDEEEELPPQPPPSDPQGSLF